MAIFRLSRKLLLALLMVAAGTAAVAWGVWHWRSPRQPRSVQGEAAAGTLGEISSEESITTEVNAKAPAFASAALGDGESIRSIDFIGEKVLLLEFWSVFCSSCIQEMPFLAEMDRKYGGEGLEVIGINTDFFGPERIQRFMSRLEPRPTYTVLHDRDQVLSRAFGVEALPVTVLIDSSGWVRMYHLGYRPDDRRTIENLVKKWLGRISETAETVGPVGDRTPVAAAGASGQENRGKGIELPELRGTDTEGQPVSLRDYRDGRPMLIFFWSLYCQPCRQEMPMLASEARRVGRGKVRFLSVNLDNSRLADQVAKFAAKQQLGFPTLLDCRSDPPGSVASSLGVAYTPTVILVGEDGRVRSILVGGKDEEELKEKLAELLKPAPGG